MGKYLLRRELGRGGMGVVYLAEDTQLGREVALKMLRPGVALGERHLDLFRREARAVAALSHPNIVHINAFDMVDDALLIEMPYLTGGSLYDQLRIGLPLVRLTRILVELLRALSCCHAAGIIHRDVKPGNVIFDGAGTAKLSDFGAAALVQGSWEDVQESGSTTTIFVGTPQYACPEAWSNAPPEPHWDLFALGMIVREALTGAPAVKASSPLEYIEKIIRNPPPPLVDMELPVSPGFAALIDRFTAYLPSDRPATAADALHELELLPEYEHMKGMSQDTIVGPLLFGPTPSVSRRVLAPLRNPRRKRAYSLGLGMAGLVGIIAVSVLAGRALPVSPAPSVAGPSDTDASAPVSPLGIANPWHSGLDPARNGWVLIQRDAARGTMEGIGVLGHQLLRFSGAEAVGGRIALEGIWGGVSDGTGTAPRYGRLTGSKQAGIAGEAGFAFELAFLSETDSAHWREVVYVSGAPHASTPEALVTGIESSRVWSRLLFGEVLPRDIEDRFRLAPFLFAAPGARIRALHQHPALGATLDGVPDESVWAEAGLARDARHPALVAVLAPGGVGIALSAPGTATAPRLLLSLSPAHHLDDTRWRGIALDESELRAPDGAVGGLVQADDRIQAELWLPVAPAGDGAWPHRDTALRLNAVLLDGDGDDATVLARWGAEVVDAVGEGVLVYLNPSRSERP